MNPGIVGHIRKFECWMCNKRIIQTCAICGLRLKSFMSRAFGSMEFNKLHKITPSRRVKAKTRISESGQLALWSAGIALHPTNHSVHSCHKSSDTLVAIFLIVLLLFCYWNLWFSLWLFTQHFRTLNRQEFDSKYIDHFRNLFCGTITIRTYLSEIKIGNLFMNWDTDNMRGQCFFYFFHQQFNSTRKILNYEFDYATDDRRFMHLYIFENIQFLLLFIIE